MVLLVGACMYIMSMCNIMASPTEATCCDKWVAIEMVYNIGKQVPEIHRNLGYPERTIQL